MITPVVAGVLRDRRGRVLLAQRPKGKHLAGTWEFPGGKLNPGESPAAGLARELTEELGIKVIGSEPLLSLTHHYADRSVRLLLREVGAWEGQPVGLESQALAWVSLGEAEALPMPEADRPMLTALALDARCAISPDPAELADIDAFVQSWEASLEAGFGWVRLRAPSLSAGQFRSLALRCGELARRYGATWMLETDPEVAEQLGADGVHLSRDRLHSCRVRPLGPKRIVTADCQNARDLSLAGRLGLDLVTLTPQPMVESGSSVPRPPLDWAVLEEMCADSPLPVLALSDLTAEHLARARAAGAFGVAGTARPAPP
ncbi:MAG: Nudix family hydrolase [Wenzhouxiangella sp.]|nr:Nudix family hydrolase [Wenzhouxiangella sp.]